MIEYMGAVYERVRARVCVTVNHRQDTSQRSWVKKKRVNLNTERRALFIRIDE